MSTAIGDNNSTKSNSYGEYDLGSRKRSPSLNLERTKPDFDVQHKTTIEREVKHKTTNDKIDDKISASTSPTFKRVNSHSNIKKPTTGIQNFGAFHEITSSSTHPSFNEKNLFDEQAKESKQEDTSVKPSKSDPKNRNLDTKSRGPSFLEIFSSPKKELNDQSLPIDVKSIKYKLSNVFIEHDWIQLVSIFFQEKVGEYLTLVLSDPNSNQSLMKNAVSLKAKDMKEFEVLTFDQWCVKNKVTIRDSVHSKNAYASFYLKEAKEYCKKHLKAKIAKEYKENNLLITGFKSRIQEAVDFIKQETFLNHFLALDSLTMFFKLYKKLTSAQQSQLSYILTGDQKGKALKYLEKYVEEAPSKCTSSIELMIDQEIQLYQLSFNKIELNAKELEARHVNLEACNPNKVAQDSLRALSGFKSEGKGNSECSKEETVQPLIFINGKGKIPPYVPVECDNVFFVEILAWLIDELQMSLGIKSSLTAHEQAKLIQGFPIGQKEYARYFESAKKFFDGNFASWNEARSKLKSYYEKHDNFKSYPFNLELSEWKSGLTFTRWIQQSEALGKCMGPLSETYPTLDKVCHFLVGQYTLELMDKMTKEEEEGKKSLKSFCTSLLSPHFEGWKKQKTDSKEKNPEFIYPDKIIFQDKNDQVVLQPFQEDFLKWVILPPHLSNALQSVKKFKLETLVEELVSNYLKHRSIEKLKKSVPLLYVLKYLTFNAFHGAVNLIKEKKFPGFLGVADQKNPLFLRSNNEKHTYFEINISTIEFSVKHVKSFFIGKYEENLSGNKTQNMMNILEFDLMWTLKDTLKGGNPSAEMDITKPIFKNTLSITERKECLETATRPPKVDKNRVSHSYSKATEKS